MFPSICIAEGTKWFCEDGNDVRFINTSLGKQKIMIIEPEGEIKELIFFLHGDSAFRPPSYQYDMARKIVKYREGAMAVAILRPGYEDGCGDQSEGDAGFKMGDNYTADVVDTLSEIIKTVQSEYNHKTILFGHSGGAALSALLMNGHSDLSDFAILAACPCDLKAWRQNRFEKRGNKRWLSDMPGLSPIEEIDNLNSKDQIMLVVSQKDKVVPPELSERYSETLAERNVDVFQIVDSIGGHDSIIEERMLETVLSPSLMDRDIRIKQFHPPVPRFFERIMRPGSATPPEN